MLQLADKTVVRGLRMDSWFGKERHTTWSLGPFALSRVFTPANHFLRAASSEFAGP